MRGRGLGGGYANVHASQHGGHGPGLVPVRARTGNRPLHQSGLSAKSLVSTAIYCVAATHVQHSKQGKSQSAEN